MVEATATPAAFLSAAAAAAAASTCAWLSMVTPGGGGPLGGGIMGGSIMPGGGPLGGGMTYMPGGGPDGGGSRMPGGGPAGGGIGRKPWGGGPGGGGSTPADAAAAAAEEPGPGPAPNSWPSVANAGLPDASCPTEQARTWPQGKRAEDQRDSEPGGKSKEAKPICLTIATYLVHKSMGKDDQPRLLSPLKELSPFRQPTKDKS